MCSTNTTWYARSLNITSELDEISTANGTSLQGSWALPSGVAYFALVVGGILNVSLLATFIRRPTLRNSFGVYLMNLLIIDTILVFAFGPLNLIDKYASTWAIGYKACLFAGHTAFTYENLVIMAHFLIAMNRLWAVGFPISYRNHHSTKLAIALCSTTWLVLNVINIPVTILTSVLVPGKINGTLKCDVDTDAMGIWYPITQLCLFDTPIFVVLLTYPVVCYKSFFQDRKQRVAPSAMSRTRRFSHAETVRALPVDPNTVGTDDHKPKKKPVSVVCGRPLRGSLTGFATLTLMTLSVIVCLMPKEAYYTWLLFSSFDPPEFNFVADIMARFTTVFDPMLVVLGNTELRTLVLALLARR